MKFYQALLKARVALFAILFALLAALSAFAADPKLTDAQITRELNKEDNKAIIDQFLKHELSDVNNYAVKPLLKERPSLDFYLKQAERSPLSALSFLENQVHALRKAQANIGSLPYVLAFTPSEKETILGLKKTADRIVSYGIPLMKRDFYAVVQAAKELAKKNGKNPTTLIPDPAFRDSVYRSCAKTPEVLDKEMGELSTGEATSMRLGWTLEQVTLTKLWMVFNDNRLPRPEDYQVFRKKRSEYWQKRLARIYK